MKISTFLLITAVFCGACFAQETPPQEELPRESPEHGMTQAKMKEIIMQISEDVSDEDGNLTFYYEGVLVALISDAEANRMRILSPVIEASRLTEEQVIATLISNYHLALDARYAIGNDVLYSVYIHPLRELTEEQLVSAVRQVTNLRTTFGTTYTSGELSFGVEVESQQLEI